MDGFFFSGQKSRGKKKTVKSSAREEGRRTYVITEKKKPYPITLSESIDYELLCSDFMVLKSIDYKLTTQYQEPG